MLVVDPEVLLEYITHKCMFDENLYIHTQCSVCQDANHTLSQTQRELSLEEELPVKFLIEHKRPLKHMLWLKEVKRVP